MTSQPNPTQYACFQHPDLEAQFYCGACATFRCKHCVKRYESVGLCPNCDALCRKVTDILAQPAEPEPVYSFEEELWRIVRLPLRHPAAMIGAWIGATLLAATIGSVSEVLGNNSPTMFRLLVSSLTASGVLGNTLAYILVGGIASGVMIRIADGLSRQRQLGAESFKHPLEPMVLFATAGLFALGPITLHLGIPFAQSVVAGMVDDPHADRFLRFSIFQHLGTVIFLAWGVFGYPLALTVGATKQDPLHILNPKTLLAALFTFRELLIPAYGVTIAAHLVAAGLVFLIRNLPFSLAVSWLILTLSVFLSFAAIGVTVKHAWSRLDFHE